MRVLHRLILVGLIILLLRNAAGGWSGPTWATGVGVKGARMADKEEPGGRPGQDRLSRRALLRRAGQGAATGIAAWVIPEIVVASPAGAQPLSAPPTAGSGGFPPGTEPGGGPPGTPPGGGGPDASTSPGSSGGAEDASATAPGEGVPGKAEPGGGSLAFTGSEAEKLFGAGATLVAGGWVIHRWASRHEPPPESAPSQS